MSPSTVRVTRKIAGLVFAAALLALWEIVGLADTTAMITPFSTAFMRAIELVTGPRLVQDILPSVGMALIGFVLGGLLGTILGVALGWFRGVEPWLRGVLEFMRAVPPPAIIPLLFLIFGANPQTRLAVIALGTLWPVLLAAIDGTRRADSGYIEAARVYAGSQFRLLNKVVLPAALPQIMAGLRIGLAIALVMMVISEMVSSTSGLGYLVLQAQRLYDLPTMYAGLILLGIIGVVFTLTFTFIERRAVAWFEGQKGIATS